MSNEKLDQIFFFLVLSLRELSGGGYKYFYHHPPPYQGLQHAPGPSLFLPGNINVALISCETYKQNAWVNHTQTNYVYWQRFYSSCLSWNVPEPIQQFPLYIINVFDTILTLSPSLRLSLHHLLPMNLVCLWNVPVRCFWFFMKFVLFFILFFLWQLDLKDKTSRNRVDCAGKWITSGVWCKNTIKMVEGRLHNKTLWKITNDLLFVEVLWRRVLKCIYSSSEKCLLQLEWFK